MEDGELTKYKTSRWCKSCDQEHGILYPCEKYPKEILDEILMDGKKFRESCSSGEIKISKNGITKTWNEWCKDGDL